MGAICLISGRVCQADQSAEVVPIEEAPFHYVVVRADLPIGIIAANIVHATGESTALWLALTSEGWPENMHAVVVTVPDEDALRRLDHKLWEARVPRARIHEPDAPYDGQMMALGLFPGRKEDLRRHLSSLPLLKEKK